MARGGKSSGPVAGCMISTAMRVGWVNVRRLGLIAAICLWSAPQWLLAGNVASGTGTAGAASVLGDDLFMAGSDLHLGDGSRGDALLAGGWISTAGTVQGDEVATGGRIDLGADVDGGLYAAGGQVRIRGKVGHNARIAGGHVEVAPAAAVQGGLTIAGGEVVVDGRIGKYLQIGAGSTRIDGQVGGNVDVASGELTVGPGAIIEGGLTYYGPQPPNIDRTAQIRGGTHFIERSHWRRPGHRHRFGAAAWIWLAGWIIAALILVKVFPGFVREVSEVARREPWVALLLGFAVLVCVPVALLLLMITIVGVPLALLLLLLYLLLLPLGYLASATAIGEWLLARSPPAAGKLPAYRMPVLIGVLIVLFLLTRIPLLGAALRFLLIVAGIGTLVLAAAQRRRGETGTATTT